LGTSGFIKTGEFSNAAFEENAPATHNYRGGCDCGNRFGLALVGQRHGAETALKVAKRLVASQQSAMSWRIFTMRARANGSVLNIIIEQPSAECGGVCDFAIALFEVFIF
jgi:hypothetical protein